MLKILPIIPSRNIILTHYSHISPYYSHIVLFSLAVWVSIHCFQVYFHQFKSYPSSPSLNHLITLCCLHPFKILILIISINILQVQNCTSQHPIIPELFFNL